MTGPRVARRPVLAAIAVLAITALGLTACGGESAQPPGVTDGVGPQAACVAPGIEMPSAVRAGTTVGITIGSFSTGCPDTPQTGATAAPVLRADVVFQQNGRSAVVGTASSSGPDLIVTTAVAIPVWAQPGPATIAAGPAAPVTVLVIA